MRHCCTCLLYTSENGRYLIEDDYDSEFRYKGRPIPALQGNDTEGKVIYLEMCIRDSFETRSSHRFSFAVRPRIQFFTSVCTAPVIEVMEDVYKRQIRSKVREVCS